MARHIRNSALENRTARLKLPVSSKPRWANLGSGTGVGYRRNDGPGTWSKRTSDGRGGYTIEKIGIADDYQEANGVDILSFFQAQGRVTTLAPTGGGTDNGKLTTVADALDVYESDLKIRGQDVANVARVRVHLPTVLVNKAVALLTTRELRHWRNGLAKVLKPASVNRTCTALRAALNLARGEDDRVTNARAWKDGLAAIPNTAEPRNEVIPVEAVRAISIRAYAISESFGLLVETAATTGARVSQLARLQVCNLQDDRSDSRLMMPVSRKGRGEKKITHRPVPIPRSLALRLRCIATGHPVDAWLLTQPNGKPWGKIDHARPFRRAVAAAGLDSKITIYALRHSNITRQLIAGVPARVVAVNHNTSVIMLERVYSHLLGDHSDAVARPAVLDLGQPTLLPRAAR